MIGAAVPLACPVEPRLRQERAGFRAAALPALPVWQQIAEGGAQLLPSQRPGLFRPFGLDCGRHCLDAFIARRPARSWWRWLRGGPWFCHHQLFAALLRFERRRTGRAYVVRSQAIGPFLTYLANLVASLI